MMTRWGRVSALSTAPTGGAASCATMPFNGTASAAAAQPPFAPSHTCGALSHLIVANTASSWPSPSTSPNTTFCESEQQQQQAKRAGGQTGRRQAHWSIPLSRHVLFALAHTPHADPLASPLHRPHTHLVDLAPHVPLPHLLATARERRHVAAGVRRHKLQAPVVVDVGDRHLGLQHAAHSTSKQQHSKQHTVSAACSKVQGEAEAFSPAGAPPLRKQGEGNKATAAAAAASMDLDVAHLDGEAGQRDAVAVKRVQEALCVHEEGGVAGAKFRGRL